MRLVIGTASSLAVAMGAAGGAMLDSSLFLPLIGLSAVAMGTLAWLLRHQHTQASRDRDKDRENARQEREEYREEQRRSREDFTRALQQINDSFERTLGDARHDRNAAEARSHDQPRIQT